MHDNDRPLSHFTNTCTSSSRTHGAISATVPTVPTGTGSGSGPICAKITLAPGFKFASSSAQIGRLFFTGTLPRLFNKFGSFGGEINL